MRHVSGVRLRPAIFCRKLRRHSEPRADVPSGGSVREPSNDAAPAFSPLVVRQAHRSCAHDLLADDRMRDSNCTNRHCIRTAALRSCAPGPSCLAPYVIVKMAADGNTLFLVCNERLIVQPIPAQFRSAGRPLQGILLQANPRAKAVPLATN